MQLYTRIHTLFKNSLVNQSPTFISNVRFILFTLTAARHRSYISPFFPTLNSSLPRAIRTDYRALFDKR